MDIQRTDLRTVKSTYEKRMIEYSKAQVQAATKIFDTASEKLEGSIVFRWQRVDFSDVVISDEDDICFEKTTAPAALGVSFAAGKNRIWDFRNGMGTSTTDLVVLLYCSSCKGSTEDGFPDPYVKAISEGMAKPLNDVEQSLKSIVSRVLSELLGAPKSCGTDNEKHNPKPVVLCPGKANPPIVPNILPLQLFKIGQMSLAGVPGELTTMAGRRLMESIYTVFDGDVTHSPIAGYANDYSQYITTKEEYDKQHYEGACTLFGPCTLSAHIQSFKRLAKSIIDDTVIEDSDVDRQKTSVRNMDRITIRSFCAGKIKFEMYDYNDEVNLVPRPDAPKAFTGPGDLVYVNPINTKIKIKIVDSGKYIGDANGIANDQMVVIKANCQDGYKEDYTPFWKEFQD